MFEKEGIQIMRVGRKQSDKGRGGRLRKVKQGEGREGEGVETEQKKKMRERETGMRPNAGPHECFRDIVKQAPSHPTY